MPTISVVVPAFNEEKYLGGLLSDLVEQTIKPDEVIIADCESEDKTVEVARSFGVKLPLKVVRSEIRSPGGARNTGAATAKCKYLLFIDADMRLPSDFIERIKQSLRQQPVDYLSPNFRSDGGHWMDSYIIWFVHQMLLINMRLLKKPSGIGGAMCVSSRLHLRVGGFNEELLWQDDIDYVKRLNKLKPPFTYLAKLYVTSSSRRFQGKGVIEAISTVLVDHSHLGQWLIQPLLRKTGRSRKYGHYK